LNQISSNHDFKDKLEIHLQELEKNYTLQQAEQTSLQNWLVDAIEINKGVFFVDD
jgi:hypothetical protein